MKHLVLTVLLLITARPQTACAQGLNPNPGDSEPMRISKRCALVSGMTMDNYKGPQDVEQMYVKSTYDICLVHAMPSNWPDAPSTLKRGRQLFREVHTRKPDLPNPEKFGNVFDKMRQERHEP